MRRGWVSPVSRRSYFEGFHSPHPDAAGYITEESVSNAAKLILGDAYSEGHIKRAFEWMDKNKDRKIQW